MVRYGGTSIPGPLLIYQICQMILNYNLG